MNSTIRAAIYALRNVTSKDLALEQLSDYDSGAVVEQLIDVLLEKNRPEIDRLVVPLLNGLQSENFAELELSTCGLLQAGYSCVPFLERYLIQYPFSQIALKIKKELEHLEKKLSAVVYSPSSGYLTSSEFTDMMIRATKISVTLGSIPDESLTQRKLKEIIEINIDAWENARSEILAFGLQAIDFLQAALMDTLDVQFRRVAPRMLALFHDKASAETFIQALGDDDAVVRNEAISALAEFPSELIMQRILDITNLLNTRLK